MPNPRYTQVSLEATPYYHCVSRCVRRSFLCGIDAFSGNSYEHRRQWVEDRLLKLATLFCIDVCSYAVMSNHVHVVIRINADEAKKQSLSDIINRWHHLFKGTYLSQRYAQGDELNDAELALLHSTVELWKDRLTDISWFMRCLNEPIARQANAEDQCTGRFWEGRYKCQALLDETALLSCMAYVDLNPLRANIANTPERSAYTSIKKRIDCLNSNQDLTQPTMLAPFIGSERQPLPEGIPFHLKDYLQLVDMTGRTIRDDKQGAISLSESPILKRLIVDPKRWLYLATQFEGRFKYAAGATHKMKEMAQYFGKQWLHGQNERAFLQPD